MQMDEVLFTHTHDRSHGEKKRNEEDFKSRLVDAVRGFESFTCKV